MSKYSVISVYVKGDYPWKMLDAAVNYGLTVFGKMDRQTLKRLAKNFDKANCKRLIIRKEKSNGLFPVYFDYLSSLSTNERSMLIRDLADSYLALLRGETLPPALHGLQHINEQVSTRPISDAEPLITTSVTESSNTRKPDITSQSVESQSQSYNAQAQTTSSQQNDVVNVTSTSQSPAVVSNEQPVSDFDDMFIGIPVP